MGWRASWPKIAARAYSLWGESSLTFRWSMGIERVLMALADLELAGGYQDNVKDNHWPLLFIQDDPNVFDSKVFAIRARLLEKFPSASIEIVTLKPGKVGQVIGKLAEVGLILIEETLKSIHSRS